MSKTVDINIIVNNEYDDFLIKETSKNLNEVIEYTEKSSSIKISKVKFIVAEKDRDIFYFPDNLLNIPYEIVYFSDDKIPDIFNKLKDSTSNYVAFYSANMSWYKDHIIESVKTIDINKSKWSVSNVELRNSLSLKNDEVSSYRIPDSFNVFSNDIVIGELVVKSEDLRLVDFNRGVIRDKDTSFFSPAYALRAVLNNYSVTDHTTCKYYMNFKEYNNIEYIDFDKYTFDVAQLKEEADKIVFSIIVNATNIKKQNDFNLILGSIKGQKFPDNNYEVILVSNFNSFALFIPENEIKKIFKNYKIIYIGNQNETDDGKLINSVYLSAIRVATGKYITYLDISEQLIYTTAYLSELYLHYKQNEKLSWVISNCFDIVNYIPRHNMLKVPNREDLFFTLFSHKRELPVNFVNITAIDKNFSNNGLSLVNVITGMQKNDAKGDILEKATIQKIQ
jgi:hypothetical protein